MSVSVLLSILFELLRARRVTAPYLAEKYRLSPRSVYRYVEKLRPFLPLFVKRGRNGGIFLADTYKLPVGFFTEEEYIALTEALLLAYGNTQKECYLTAKQKLASSKTASLPQPLRLEGSELLFLGEEEDADKLRLSLTGIRKRRLLHLSYLSGEEKTEHVAEPHTLFFAGGEWYLYAFSRTLHSFLSFRIRDIYGLLLTVEGFRPRRYEQKDLLGAVAGMR